MRKFCTSLFLLIVICITTLAQQRNSDEALLVASDFLQKNGVSLRNKTSNKTNLSLVYTSKTINNGLRSNTNDVNYYIFNINNESGFIIISGDKQATAVLGYSDENYFDINNIPDNLKYWLSFYEKEIGDLRSLNFETEYNVNKKQIRSIPVAPLLGKIKWNQGEPYNNLCPEYETGKKSASGCVATAMAQIMKYYEWPVKGIGSNTYSHTFDNKSTTTISANFSATTYDWANMTPTYNASSTTTQNNAVSTLMFHCGVAVNMSYEKESGATSLEAARAFVNHFNYDKSLQHINRDQYSKIEWNEIIKDEIAAGRPVYYAGSSSRGGHAFVCDGYDANDLFHINWGWGGTSNGYFALSALTPNTQGIGGSSGGYNINQRAIIGIQKTVGTTNPILNLKGIITKYPRSSVNINTNFSISFNIYNNSIENMQPTVSLALYDYNNNFVTTLLGGNSLSEIKPGWGYSEIQANSCKISSSVVQGTYKLYIVYKIAGDSNWRKVIGNLGEELTVKVKNNTAEFNMLKPELILESLSAKNNLYQNQVGTFEASVRNTGKIDLSSMMSLKLISKDDNTKIAYIACDPVVIGKGETAQLNFSDIIDVTPGKYSLSLIYDTNNQLYNTKPIPYNNFQTIGNSIDIDILAEPIVNTYSFSMEEGSFPDNDNVTVDNFDFTCTVKNTGDYYNGPLYIAFNDPNGIITNQNSYRSYDNINVILESNESKTISFKVCPPIEPGKYRIALLIYDGIKNSRKFLDGEPIPFTLKDEDDRSIQEDKNNDLITVYPNPATDKVYINSSDILTDVTIYDLLGKQVIKMYPNMSGKIPVDVENLIKGNYILRYTTEKESKTTKFIKQ